MKLTTVLSAVNDNSDYYNFLPYQVIFWNKYNIKFICVFVGDKIPDNLQPYKQNIILWPYNNDISSAFVAQNIRLYYPALLSLPDDECVMITDMDMLPCSDTYYKSGCEPYSKQDFVYYRYISDEDKHVYICYNSAHPETWGNVFGITCSDDIIKE